MSVCGEPKFYDKDGNELSRENFIAYYNERYFIGTDKVCYKIAAENQRAVGKNSEFAEKLIEEILEKDPQDFSDSDVALILAWKIGKIAHAETEKKQKLILHTHTRNKEDSENWRDALGDYTVSTGTFENWNGEPVKRYGGSRTIMLDIKKIAAYLREHGAELNDLIGADKIEKALNQLIRENWQGIGPVYLITLLYFATNHQHPGACPIYDRFAMRAVLAIRDKTRPGGVVECGELPDKSSKNCANVVAKQMKKYKDRLREVFGGQYNRDIDRALWVYGHLFQDSLAGKCCSRAKS